MIILQLKSTQNTNALTDISSIIDYIYDKYGYRIKGHEIQQLRSNIRKMTLIERASMISSFCTHHEIEYLTYHAPIFRYNIFDERWHSRIIYSLCITIKEIERVFCKASLKNKVIIVFHLTNFISKELLPTISKEIKYKIMIVLVIRTRKPLFKSKPSKHLLISTLSIVGTTAILPFTPVAQIFGFTGLSPLYFLVVGVIVLLYIIAAEIVKEIFYKRVKLETSAITFR